MPKGQVGLDHCQVRSQIDWYRHCAGHARPRRAHRADHHLAVSRGDPTVVGARSGQPAVDQPAWSGTPFRQALTDLGITSNRVWGLARHDAEWSDALEAVLRSTRPPNLNHGSYSAYLKGCVCRECREANLLRIKAGKRTA
jgi:hypothetical protein